MKLNAINGFILDDLGRIVGEYRDGEKIIHDKPFDSFDGNPFWDAVRDREQAMDAFPDIEQFRKNTRNKRMAIPPKQYQAFPNLEGIRGLLEHYNVSGAREI